jgi:hypothetical protein
MTKQQPSNDPAQAMPAAVITHTVARIQAEQSGDITVYHSRTPTARMTLTWGGLLMTFWSAEATQSVLEGFAAARPMLAHVTRQFPPPPTVTTEPFAHQTLALDWTRRVSYAIVAREELSRDKLRLLRWLDIFMGPVTCQILDQTGYRSALEILRRAHATATHVFLDGSKFRADPTRDDYRPPK